MENPAKPKEKFTQSLTFKGIVIFVLTMLMLIPGAMIRSLIRERQERSVEAIDKINAKWSRPQTIRGPILSIPYTVATKDENNNPRLESRILNIVPAQLDVRATIFPEERHYGIYKTILYKSRQTVTGHFDKVVPANLPPGTFDESQAQIRIGVSDLRGVSDDITFTLNGKTYSTEPAGDSDDFLDKVLVVKLRDLKLLTAADTLFFSFDLNLKGSSNINYVPVGRTTTVEVRGNWKDPGFIGNYSPEYTLSDSGFVANWKVLSFNRNIPDQWNDNNNPSSEEAVFGVNLVSPVDHYQQNMRSAKYMFMFIALTFVAIFFVEVLTRRRIHPLQYLLVGIALTLFYSLLLSFSEQVGFRWAYLIAAAATVGLITAYMGSTFKSRTPTAIMSLILALLYLYLYVILQLEDSALLAGSIGLFVILALIMYFSRKVNWYRRDAVEENGDGAK